MSWAGGCVVLRIGSIVAGRDGRQPMMSRLARRIMYDGCRLTRRRRRRANRFLDEW